MKKLYMALVAASCLIGGVNLANASTLVYCSDASPTTFTPALAVSSPALDAAHPVYNQLIEFDNGQLKLVPGLAEKWEVSADGKTITFHLRKGVKFHAGVNGFTPTRTLDADDVLFSFQRQMDPNHPYAKIGGGSFDFFNSMDMQTLLASVTKVDDYTVVFKLNVASATILANLAMDFASIHSAEYADFLTKKGRQEEFDHVPVGTGPFQFVNYQKDAVIRYKAFPDYWRGKPSIDNLVYAIIPDPTTRLAKLSQGECHLIASPRPADIDEIKANPDLQLISGLGLNVAYWAFNTQKKPFDDKRVRQAISMAVDKASILREVYQGEGEVAVTAIPPTMWAYDKDVKDYKYDPEKAKQLLTEAGISTPASIDIWYSTQQRPYNPNAKRVAEMLQSDLAKVGIDGKLVTYERGELTKRMKAGEPVTSIAGWTGDNGDPDNFFFLLGCAAAEPGGVNYARWCNKDFDDRLLKARATTDQTERAKLYREMQEIMKDEAPWLPIAHSVAYEAARKEVVGYQVSPLGRHEFYGVSLR